MEGEGATWESSPSSSSSPSSNNLNESPKESSPLPRFQPSSNYDLPTTNLPLMELDSPFQGSQISTQLGERSESPIMRTQWNNRWNPPNHIAMLTSSIPFGPTEEQFHEVLNQAAAGGSINFPIPYQYQHPIMPNQQMNNWTSEGHQGIQLHSGLNGRSISRCQGNTIYDPMYETIGLPVDPHLRMFAARRGN